VAIAWIFQSSCACLFLSGDLKNGVLLLINAIISNPKQFLHERSDNQTISINSPFIGTRRSTDLLKSFDDNLMKMASCTLSVTSVLTAVAFEYAERPSLNMTACISRQATHTISCCVCRNLLFLWTVFVPPLFWIPSCAFPDWFWMLRSNLWNNRTRTVWKSVN
jgi:hypothetical protein